ncbi:MAG: penicillin acylase family protein [Pseudomonadales bacterium]|nr:penicillin acylase family protein [Pseudomonadales bacterium]
MKKWPVVSARNGASVPGSCRALAMAAVFGLATITGDALAASANQQIDRQASYEATVYRTDGGIPHIVAADHGSLGFGTGYAMAEDIVCLLADQRFLTFSAERSRFLGPQQGNLESDFFYKLFIDRGDALEPLDTQQAALFRGAAAGYNRYLRDTGIDNIPDQSCRGKPWVREIDAVDWRRISRMNFLLPFLLNQIVAATPPTVLARADESPVELPDFSRVIADALNPGGDSLIVDIGSNGLGIGRRATADGTGMLLINPHQPWTGISRFYAFHQTIPGRMNMLGANVIGRPQVAFGTSEHVSWTSTVSTAPRNSIYMLRLVPGEPTKYIFDGVPHDMVAETVTVQVSDGQGGLETRSHTFYSTHFGAFLMGGAAPWTTQIAFAIRPTVDEWRGVNALAELWKVTSVRELKAVHDKYQFSPANMIAADSLGVTWFADPGPIPNLGDAQRASCAMGGGALDGSRSDCMWNTDPDAAAPGIFGPRKLPNLFRTDFVLNSNDSHWLTNPRQPLSGYDSSLGSVDSARSMRTRAGLTQVLERLSGEDGQAGEGFTLEQLQALMFSNLAYAGKILRDDLVTLCGNNPSVTLPDGTAVDISPACPVLAQWDLHDDLDSRGAHLFREFAAASSERNYRVPFDLNDPVNTPRGLDTGNNPAVLRALATAVKKLNDAGVPLDARLGDIQYVVRNGERIPMHGGTGQSGNFNIVVAPFSASAGAYPNVTSGGSWIQATEFTREGPVSRGILSYSQTPNPDSPHYADQTRMFAEKRWLELPFRVEDVAAKAVAETPLLEGQDSCKQGGWRDFGNPSFANLGQCVTYFETLRRQRLDEIRGKS